MKLDKSAIESCRIHSIVLWPLQGLLKKKINKTFQFSLQSFSSVRKKIQRNPHSTHKNVFFLVFLHFIGSRNLSTVLAQLCLSPPSSFISGRYFIEKQAKIPFCRFSATPLIKKNFIPIIFQGSFTLISRLSPKVPSDISTSTHFTRA